MRYFLLSDIHANLTALEAVLEQAEEGFDEVVCLGDLVGYGPDPNEVTTRVKELKPSAAIRGNHDKACCGISGAEGFNAVARAAVQWTRERLSVDARSYLCGLTVGPAMRAGFHLVHGSPRDEDEYLFSWLDVEDVFSEWSAPLTFFGHTHLQGGFVLRSDGGVSTIELAMQPGVAGLELTLEADSRYLVNPGSVGQPRDGDPRAAFALYDDEERKVEYRRVPYDIEATQQRMGEAGLPEPLIYRLSLGR